MKAAGPEVPGWGRREIPSFTAEELWDIIIRIVNVIGTRPRTKGIRKSQRRGAWVKSQPSESHSLPGALWAPTCTLERAVKIESK